MVRTAQGKLDIGNKPTSIEELNQAAWAIVSAGQKFKDIMAKYNLMTKMPNQ